MKTIKIITMAALLWGAITTAQAQTNVYTGNWKRSDTQTDPGGLSINTVPQALKITADNKAIYVDATITNDDEETHHGMDTLKLDGSINSFFTSSNIKKQTSLSWSPDKSRFAAKLLILNKDGDVLQEWKQAYSASTDGRSLKIVVDIQSNGQTAHLVEVFDKQ